MLFLVLREGDSLVQEDTAPAKSAGRKHNNGTFVYLHCRKLPSLSCACLLTGHAWWERALHAVLHVSHVSYVRLSSRQHPVGSDSQSGQVRQQAAGLITSTHTPVWNMHNRQTALTATRHRLQVDRAHVLVTEFQACSMEADSSSWH